MMQGEENTFYNRNVDQRRKLGVNVRYLKTRYLDIEENLLSCSG